MKPETLESLLIDRSLNELEPEVSELLEAYLQQNLAAAEKAAQFQTTVNLAREVAVSQVEQAASLFNRRTGSLPVREERPSGLAARSTWRDFLFPFPELARGVAFLALGLALGLAVSSLWKVPPAVTGNVPTPIAVAQLEPPAHAAAQFWSLSTVAAQRQAHAETARPAPRARVEWNSLFKTPRVEEEK